ncbi:MAG TPA: tail fiber domain-containing protein [Roseateles sp.]
MSVVAVAVVGSAVIGGAVSNNASKRNARSADKLAASGDEAAQLGRDQFEWYKAEYEKTAPQREAAAALDAKVGEAQFKGMEFATQQARELDERNKSVFRPLEDKIIADAKAFDTDAKREELAGVALTDTNQAFANARGQQARANASYGITPGSGRAAAIGNQLTTSQALASAGAMTKARRDATAEGYARKMDAVGLGKGIVGNQVTMQQVAQNGGAQAVGAVGSGVNVAQSGAGLMGQGFAGAQGGLMNQGSLYGRAAEYRGMADKQQQSALSQFGMGAGWATGDAGMQAAIMKGTSIFSDEDIKTNTGKPANTKKALAEVDATQVDEGWTYDESKGAPQGSGGTKHTGPMAQQVRKTMGEKVAPGGKVIDLVSMNGKLMASMQELSKRVKKIEERAAA